MSETVTANDGTQLPLDALATGVGYTGNLVTTLTVVYNTVTYKQTFTYSGTLVTSWTGWIKQ